MKNVQTIFIEFLSKSMEQNELNLSAKDFILKRYFPAATIEPHGDGFRVKHEGVALGFGKTEDEAWEDATTNELTWIIDEP